MSSSSSRWTSSSSFNVVVAVIIIFLVVTRNYYHNSMIEMEWKLWSVVRLIVAFLLDCCLLVLVSLLLTTDFVIEQIVGVGSSGTPKHVHFDISIYRFFKFRADNSAKMVRPSIRQVNFDFSIFDFSTAEQTRPYSHVLCTW